VREPDTNLLRKMAELYNVSDDFLLGITNKSETANGRSEEDDWTREELEETERFKEFLRMKQKHNN